jgi:REP element-mobilizing transposase RayT
MICRRNSIRLAGYDYSRAGAYFVTICVQNQLHLLGAIENGSMICNDAGAMVHEVWQRIPLKFPTTALDEFVVMPNHIHLLLWLDANDVGAIPRGRPHDGDDLGATRRGRPQDGGQAQRPAPTAKPSLPDVMAWFKSLTTASYRHEVYDHNWTPYPGKLWQRSYFDHIVRTEEALAQIRLYIRENPARWNIDRYHPQPAGVDPRAAEIWRILQAEAQQKRT